MPLDPLEPRRRRPVRERPFRAGRSIRTLVRLNSSIVYHIPIRQDPMVKIPLRQSRRGRPHCISQQLNPHHFTNHAIQSKVCLAHRRQHPLADEQPAHQRIQAPPVCGNNVQKYSLVRGHVKCCHCENVANYQYSTTNSFPCITCQLFNHPTEHPALQR